MRNGPTNQVLIIGAHGILGALAARTFEAAGWEVRRGARNPRAGEVQIDLDVPDTVNAAIDPSELVVNTVPHSGLVAERAVLARGGTLINISALPVVAGRSLRATAGGAGGTVLMNAGLAPGVTSLVAADVLRAHPAADELELVFTLSTATPRGPASADFVRRGLTAIARHRTMLVPLPSPFGERRCLGFGESDTGWLGGVAEGRVVRLYICISEAEAHAQMLALNRAGAMSGLPRSLLRARPSSAGGAASREPVAHWVAARRGERRLGSCTIECDGHFIHAARAAVLFADALLARSLPGGCFDPDEICTLAQMESKLRAAGVRIVRR